MPAARVEQPPPCAPHTRVALRGKDHDRGAADDDGQGAAQVHQREDLPEVVRCGGDVGHQGDGAEGRDLGRPVGSGAGQGLESARGKGRRTMAWLASPTAKKFRT